MIEHRQIRATLRAQLLTVPGLPAAKSWENRGFQPPSGADWVRETYLPGGEWQSASDALTCVGLVQYDLFTPADSGTEAIEDLADAIKSAFRPPQSLSGVVIERAERLPGRVDGPWYMVPVRIGWRAHAVG